MYDPTTNDVGYYLRATVAYDDREGDSKSAMASSVNPVQVIRSPNAATCVPAMRIPRQIGSPEHGSGTDGAREC